eukprot:gene11523-14111_t
MKSITNGNLYQLDFDYEKTQTFQVNQFITLPEINNWNYIDNPQFKDVYSLFTPSNIVLIRGRRRIGKTILIKSVGYHLQKEGKPIVYIYCAQDQEVYQLAHLVIWLIKCGVSVILDEFQRLTNAFNESLQGKIDTTDMKNSNGSLILMGSHAQLLDSRFDGTAPLFGRISGWLTINPFNPNLIYGLLKSRFPKLSPNHFLSFYSFANGHLDISYHKELFQNSSVVLGIVFENESSKPHQLIDAIKKRNLPSDYSIYLSDLEKFQFIKKFDPVVPSNSGDFRYKVIDLPFRASKSLNSGQYSQLEGFSLEMVNWKLLPNFLKVNLKASEKLEIMNDKYWNEGAEIDFFSIDPLTNTIFLGSCKRDEEKHNPTNLLIHFLCYLLVKEEPLKIKLENQFLDFDSFTYYFLLTSPTWKDDKEQLYSANNLKSKFPHFLDYCNDPINILDNSLRIKIFGGVLSRIQEYDIPDKYLKKLESYISTTNNNKTKPTVQGSKTDKKPFPNKFPIPKIIPLGLLDLLKY